MIKTVILRTVLLVGGLVLSLYACAPLPTPHDYYVSTTGNDSNDCLSPANACLTIDAAAGRATPQSRILIGAGTFPTNVTLAKWLSISGAGLDQTTLSATSPTAAVVTVSSNVHAQLSDLTISGGRVGVNIDGSSIETQVTLKSVIITHAQVGVNDTLSALELIDADINNNGSGVVTEGGTLNISTSSFGGNADYAIVNSGVAALDHVTADANGTEALTAAYQGAISNISSSGAIGRMQISNSTITRNGFAGIENQAGSVNISATLIDGNGIGVINSGPMSLDTSVVTNNGQFGVANTVGIFLGVVDSAGNSLQITRTAINDNGLAPTIADDPTGGVVIFPDANSNTITNSTMSGNHGYGVDDHGGIVTLSYDTVVSNTSNGLELDSSGPTTLGTANVNNSIIALNAAPNCHNPSLGTLNIDPASLACNDALANPALGVGPLANDAGTWVNPLQAASPAIDHASGSCPAVDQRGYSRPVGSACDVGAYEFGAGAHLTAATPVSTTPTLPVLQIVTLTPSPTATETPTPLAAPQLTFILNANCRKGPGSAYDIVTSFVKGVTLDAAGRNSDSSWWLVMIPTGGTCWVGNSTVSKVGAVDQLPIVQAPSLPDTPSKAGNTFVCDAKKLKTLTVMLNWASVSGASGYNLFRNGSLLITVGGGTTSYKDNAPLGIALTYEIQTINSVGVSGMVSTSVPACK